MEQRTFIILIILAAVIAVVLFKFFHKHTMDYNKEDLEKNIVSIFNGHDGDEMSRSDFLKELKRVYHCTQKEAVFLLGAAQRIRLVGMTDSTVRLL